MVTKQEQLEWLAVNIKEWNSAFNFVLMSVMDVGVYAYPGDKVRHEITFNEWQQERDKMSSKPKVDNSWHERGEFPPAGCECEVKDGGVWHKTHIVGFDDDGYCVYTRPWSTHLDYDGDMCQSNFRPLSTEREKAIDEMIKLIGHGYMSAEMANELAIKMYDDGLRMTGWKK